MMFDETLAEVNAQVIDAKMSKTFEWMFDDFMDGIFDGWRRNAITIIIDFRNL